MLAVCGGTLGYAAMTGTTTATESGVPEAPPTQNYTVVTESARFGTIIAYAPDGSVYYYNNSHTKYYDVDPVENASMTVEYTATDTIHTKGPHCRSPPCARNAIERVNLTTGEVTELFVRYAPQETAAEWHDADRINDTHVAVADMVDDEVYVVNTSSGVIDWAWGAQSEFPLSGGGPYPGDWAHLNDVEVLDDGRIMLSLRNQDQIVFINRTTGLQENWTLGADGNHSVQFAQHNPDYIPKERGGPALVVADSQNNRIVEYQRRNGSWVRTWTWSDSKMQWPRDADRLPNGNTLITDTNGKRLMEVNESGAVVWQVRLSHPYEAERLGTGDESAGGQSAASLGLDSQTRDGGAAAAAAASRGRSGLALPGFVSLAGVIRDLFPHRIVNAAIYVSPVWVGTSELGFVLVGLLTGLVWAGFECRRALRSSSFTYQHPIRRDED